MTADDSSAPTAPGPGPASTDAALHQETLPCGRSVDDLLEQVADGHAEDLDAHQADCPHCQAALGEFGQLWAPVAELATRPVEVPVDLASRVMAHVHRLVQDTWYTLQLTELGAINVAARIVARIARDAARTVPGVRVALGRSTQGRIVQLVDRATRLHRHPHSAVGVLGQTAAVDLAIAVEYGEPVNDIASEVQRRVATALKETITLQQVTVNVTVDDVLLDL